MLNDILERGALRLLATRLENQQENLRLLINLGRGWRCSFIVSTSLLNNDYFHRLNTFNPSLGDICRDSHSLVQALPIIRLLQCQS
jgi:hypothetical protein